VASLVYFGKQIVLDILLKILGVFGWSARKLISIKDWENFLSIIRPIEVGSDLVRIGGSYDGSYLVPDDLESISMLISPGIGESRAFEDELYSRFGICSILIDPNTQPTHLNPGDLYLDKSISGSSSSTGITIQELVETTPRGDLVLQMDIESGEYESLAATNSQTLNRFRVIIVEFHRTDLWIDNIYFQQIIKPVFEKILKDFDVAHIHPNTSCGYFEFHSVKFPKFAEFTFYRKDRVLLAGGGLAPAPVPHALDTLTKASDEPKEWVFTNNS